MTYDEANELMKDIPVFSGLSLDDDAVICDVCEEGVDLTQPDQYIRAFITDHRKCIVADEDDFGDRRDPYDDGDDWQIDGVGFADPGGRSALRAATPDNPRNLPCPTCKRPNMLTPIDQQRGYQCDICADALERGFDY
jgi:hypothetical protein